MFPSFNFSFRPMRWIACGSLPLILGGLAHCQAAPPPVVSESRISSLRLGVDEQGLTSIRYGEHEFLSKGFGVFDATDGTPVFTRADGTSYKGDPNFTSSSYNPKNQTVTKIFPQLRLSCSYKTEGERLIFTVSVSNLSADTLRLTAKLGELRFPSVPQAQTLDSGIFGTAGNLHPLHEYPLQPDPQFQPGAIFCAFEGGTLLLGVPNPHATAQIRVPYTTDKENKTLYPVLAVFPRVEPGKTVNETFIFGFGKSGATLQTLGSDLLSRYRALYPATLQWKDRRPIGANFLSSQAVLPSKNPRGWFNNSAQTDLSTSAGIATFRADLLSYAQESVKILRRTGAQGVITWDIEGQEWPHATSYIGDPRVIGKLAPEMEWKPSYREPATIDAYFHTFIQAGFKVGICIRPQDLQLTEVEGKIVAASQQDAPNPLATLRAKARYAKTRFGATIFYVDSNSANNQLLDPEIFASLNREFPDCLFIPELESSRYFAYSAPYNQFAGFGLLETPAINRELYPGAFSVMPTPSRDFEKYRAIQTAAAKRGDIFLFNAWYDSDESRYVQSLYQGTNK